MLRCGSSSVESRPTVETIRDGGLAEGRRRLRRALRGRPTSATRGAERFVNVRWSSRANAWTLATSKEPHHDRPAPRLLLPNSDFAPLYRIGLRNLSIAVAERDFESPCLFDFVVLYVVYPIQSIPKSISDIYVAARRIQPSAYFSIVSRFKIEAVVSMNNSSWRHRIQRKAAGA